MEQEFYPSEGGLSAKGSELNNMALVHVILFCEQNTLTDILLCALTGEEMG